MTDGEILQLITLELANKTLGATEQYLEIHDAVYENNLPKISRIDREDPEGLVIVYLPVKDEYFYFAVYIDPLKNEIINIGTESRNSVSLVATSDKLTAAQMQALIKLKPTAAFSKGDSKPNNKSIYNYSCIQFTPNPEPDTVEDKLKKLLLLLQNNTIDVISLTNNTNAHIQITMDFHYGNQLLGGVGIDMESIEKLNKLNLPINFEMAAWGNSFKESH